MEKINIIITAGGSGMRMGADIPKQFLLLNGRPILFRTVEFFASLEVDMDIHVVLPPLYMELWNESAVLYNMQVPCNIVTGGLTRFHSVRNALAHLVSGSITAVHDGVRPILSQEMVLRCFELAHTHPAVIPVVEVYESMRRSEGVGTVPVDRTEYRLVQTPQVFWTESLKQAYQQSYLPCFTDDASVVERMGVPLFLTKGEIRNIKITTPEDLELAKLLVPPLLHCAVFDPDLTLDGLVKGD
jgi:2-C-methyl-D-erythritol 4-phosphate cytidylyltransferase